MITQRIADNIYEVPADMKLVKVEEKILKFQMKVPARIYANEYLMERIKKDKSVDQITNVACLPGIRKHVIAMSDAHQGYGFCIGGVAASDIDGGAISPGGVGYDINCGVRLLRTGLDYSDVAAQLPELTDGLFHNIPSGLGSKGKLRITPTDLNQVLDEGINWAIDNGYGFDKDREFCEDHGLTKGADSSLVSKRAKDRGIRQLGSLGSGNHFIEIQRVEEILDLQEIDHLMHRNGIIAPDRELGYVISGTKEADRYLAQMRAAANFAWTNRHIIMHWARETFHSVLGLEPSKMELIYGLAHNILKQEEHDLGNGERGMVNVHRKGATRAFPPGHRDVPEKYKEFGQPVLIPGSMGTSSYLCVGQEKAMDLSFASTAHGGGREMSRSKAKRQFWGKTIKQELGKQGIVVRAASLKILAEEAPLAYKNIDEVVGVSHNLGIIKKVAKLVPIGVTKG